MMHLRVSLCMLAVLTLIPARAATQELRQQTFCDQACELLRDRIEAAGVPQQLTVSDEVIYASDVLPRFYERRAYRVVWSGNDGPLPRAYDLMRVIRGAEADGLRPADYHLERIERALERLPAEIEDLKVSVPHLLVELDLLLTDAFLIYASHLLNGHVNPETIDPEWHIVRSEVDLAKVLQDALAGNSIQRSLDDLLARSPCASRLREALAYYRDLAAAGGWPTIPDGPALKKGDRGERVQGLRLRLAAAGYLFGHSVGDLDYFDDRVDDAVRVFQERHGLEVDGIVGRNTLAELNVTAEQRVHQIMVNMERWRWLPRDLGERHVLVNIADFEMSVLEAGERVMVMRVIVGKDYRRTPVFSDVMTYLVLNPYWNVPHSIAVDDKIPLIREDPGYLAENGMRVLEGWGADSKEIEPDSIDWASMTAETFPYRLRQEPGPANTLGRVKFMFPNRFNVYLHDTPARELFDQTVRTFSSGCIRIEKPIDFAVYLLRASPEWSRASILAALDRGEEQTVSLPEPIRIYILYCTAWVDQDGNVQFRRDVYGRDDAVGEALFAPAPEA